MSGGGKLVRGGGSVMPLTAFGGRNSNSRQETGEAKVLVLVMPVESWLHLCASFQQAKLSPTADPAASRQINTQTRHSVRRFASRPFDEFFASSTASLVLWSLCLRAPLFRRND